MVNNDIVVITNTHFKHSHIMYIPGLSLLLSLIISCCTFACFLLFCFFLFLFLVIMTSRCFNFRFAYPLPLLPYLHKARMASGHPTDKFSFMFQPDTHKRYGTHMHTHLHTCPHSPTYIHTVSLCPCYL